MHIFDSMLWNVVELYAKGGQDKTDVMSLLGACQN